MKLDKHVVDMFTELTKPADDVKMEKTCYGTISVVDGTRYVKLDGSDLLVPAASTVKTSHGDRVTVLMKNHSLTVTGNLTAPATDGEGGSSGEAGTAATIEVGTVTTGEAGSSASVTNVGTTSAAVFDFVIPRGDTGPQGPQGETGTAATIKVGRVTTVEGAILASVTNSGTTSAAVFDFVIPRGEKGEKGEKGDTGTWDGTIPDHEHTVSDITDFPTSLPANGGNADTLDGKHASDFSQIINLGHTSTDTKNALGIQYQTTAYWCFNWTDYPAGMYDGQGMIIAAHYNSYGTTVGVDSIWCRQIFISPHPNTKIYQRIIANTDVGEWTSISDGGNADTLNGLHASDFISTTELAFQSICPSNVFLYDDLNSPSVMVKIPKMTWAQLGVGDSTEVFPAFIVNGRVVDALYFSKYENIVRNNRGYSLPAQDPADFVDHDQSVAYSTAKGAGWHSMTRLEWCVIALWCLQNGFQPNGNNNFGKDASENTYKAIPTLYHSDGRTQRVATGTGPLTWYHNNAPDGIADMNGNVWEWTTGVRLVYGELQVLSHDGVTFGNDAAHPDNSQAADSTLWRAIDGTTGVLITPDGSGTTANSLKLDFVSSAWKWITGTISSKSDRDRGTAFENTTVDSTVCTAAQRILQALCLYKASDVSGAYKEDFFWANNGAAEQCFFAGGRWTISVRAGVFTHSGDLRSYSSVDLGFRSAFVNLPTT